MLEENQIQDNDVRHTIGTLLRVGIIASSLLVIFGGIIYLYRHGHETPDYKSFQGLLSPYHSLHDLAIGIVGFKGRAIIQAGVLLLIATPIVRIVFSLIGFIKEKDRLYVLITTIVLAIILFSIFSGIKA